MSKKKRRPFPHKNSVYARLSPEQQVAFRKWLRLHEDPPRERRGDGRDGSRGRRTGDLG